MAFVTMASATMALVALKVGLASSLGVMFGWQPIPGDDSNTGRPQIEYIVQIEPELAATLQAGQSIPITSDVPADIGPIGRIRIVVGRDELPRQKLATRFKPWPQDMVATPQTPKSLAAEGLIETQYRVDPVAPSAVAPSGSGRYGNTAGANNTPILPPGSEPRVATNPLARSLQQGVQNAQEQAAGLANRVKDQILPPTGKQLFGQNGINRESVQNAVNNTATDFNRNLQQAAQRGIQQAANQTGQQLRQAADNLGQRGRQAIDQLGSNRSLAKRSTPNNGPQNQSTATILPPNSTQAGNIPLTPKGQRIDQPVQPPQPQHRLQENTIPPANIASEASPARTNSTSQPGNPAWPNTANTQSVDNRAGSAGLERYDNSAIQPPATTARWPSKQPRRDSFDVANLREENSRPNYPNNRQPPYTATNNNLAAESRTDGPALYAPASQTAVQDPLSQNNGAGWPNHPSRPEITKRMLSPSAGGNGYQTVGTPTQDYQHQNTNQPTPNTLVNNFGSSRGDGSRSPENPTGPKSDVFPLLLSWVLLSGSGAGNAYLWWSYLDLRNKYQGVVHSSPRRRDRYDD